MWPLPEPPQNVYGGTVTTKTYLDAVEEGFVYWDYVSDHGGEVVEELISIGYRAGLTDGVRVVKDAAGSVPPNDPSINFYRVAIDKFAAVARKFEDRVSKNRVADNIKKS